MSDGKRVAETSAFVHADDNACHARGPVCARALLACATQKKDISKQRHLALVLYVN